MKYNLYKGAGAKKAVAMALAAAMTVGGPCGVCGG